MRHRYAGWVSAIAVVAGAAALGCASSDNDEASGGITTAGVGGAAPTAGTSAAAAGAGGMGMMMPAGTGAVSAGTGGTAAPAGSGGMSAGSGGQPAAGGSGGSSAAGAGGGGGEAGAPMAGTGGGASGMCMPTTNVDADGPYTPTHIENGGPSGGSWVFYPEELGEGGMTHPVFNWGPGAGTGPSQYTDHLNRLASHGFVVISQPSSGSGTTEKAALDWLLAENEMSGSAFYQKLDPERVGAGGHSLGALTTMAMAGDPRLTMYVLVCGGCMSGNGGCGAADIHGPTIILGGDSDIGTPNFEGDYEEITTPVVFVTKDGTDHIACARNNLAPWVAFMRMTFCGEDQYMADFMDGGTYCTTPWTCKSKGW